MKVINPMCPVCNGNGTGHCICKTQDIELYSDRLVKNGFKDLYYSYRQRGFTDFMIQKSIIRALNDINKECE